MLGWLVTLVAIVALTVLVTGGKPLLPNSTPSTGALAVKLAVGVVLVFIAYRRWGKRGTSEPKRQPKWMAGIDRINPLAAAGLGFLLQPWVLVTAGVADHHPGQALVGREYLAVFAFCVCARPATSSMEIYAALRPDEVKSTLDALLEWINSHRDQVDRVPVAGTGLISWPRASTGW